MRIESLTIKNFRQYRDVEFTFTKKIGKKDMHIILGQNGEGKTNMLNAITWCLYGHELHLGDKYSAQGIINNSYVEELRNTGQKYGDVSVTLELSSGSEIQQRLKIQRKGTFAIQASTVRDIDSSYSIMERTTEDWRTITDEDECKNLIHRYVPEEINQYIFFDGEQLEKYFQDVKKEQIQSGIEELTQASDLQKAVNAFDKYIQQELNPKLRNSSNSEVQKYQLKVERIQIGIDKIKTYINDYKEDIIKYEAEIDKLTNYIRGSEKVKEKLAERDRLEADSDSLKARKYELWQRMMVFTREYYQYLAVYPAMKAFYDFIKEQDNLGNLPPKIDKNFLLQFLSSPKCLICGSPMTEDHRNEIEALVEKINVGSDASQELNQAMSAIQGYFYILKQYPVKKKQFTDDMAKLNASVKQNENDYAKISEDLKSIPDAEERVKALATRDTFTQKVKDRYSRIGAEVRNLQTETAKLDEANALLAKALESNKQLESLKKMLDYCKNSKILLDKIKQEILEDCRLEMQEETFEIFKDLLWKKEAFSKVQIEEDYSFKLIDVFGNQTLGSSSAGERVLLALSFTLALQKVSKHDSLLYIDTPVGRVDNNNRKNFMEALLNVADEKQVILTFTPSEYNHVIQEVLADYYSSFFILQMKDNVTQFIDKDKKDGK